MLSRTAQGLYWMSRYVERAENIARLLDAGRRMEALPGPETGNSSEWASIVIAAGCRETFSDKLENADRDSALQHLVFDVDNPSSVTSCFAAARENARAMRGSITSEVWEAINGAWANMRAMSPDQVVERSTADFIDSVLAASFHFRGAINATLLRDERLWFIDLGKHIERADATARLLDVKYNVLLPEAAEVGSGLDLMQWQQILRATNALRAFRHVYRENVSAPKVVDLLVLNPLSPRSLRYSYEAICQEISNIGVATKAQRDFAEKAQKLRSSLTETTAEGIIGRGLHEWLTEMIIQTNKLAVDLGDVYGFAAPVTADLVDVDVTSDPPIDQMQHQK